ncbi:2-phosphosulfolactate phosphatase [Actinoalloteichus hymeniacidonis]|uniref:Probable 2-phosphosulfolactate phosphatase n=1 Tax=Actinoalloteichus hymeniacidonis TaxID=340345 RepID=A0AAC9HP52_9PSEU|nr:2-phosphosulfolactate phosphatase [Actinoalloteichus hymeniacidonis]AOS62406.1 phosphosulfolactate phosphohydrolase-like enzyme [Actinoalloteichus hymeniacidonis]MBB5909563.1 2-phosphosulfolactate phosphatase [Actinoalloteichus hymeniacidonis]
MADPAIFRQSAHRIRFDWGVEGLDALAPDCAVLVVIDVLSFSTTVDVAVGRGATVLPLPWRDERAGVAATQAGAVLAGPRSGPGWTLSPASLADLPAETLLALPSPNGATLCARAAEADGTVLAGCLRNARAVARLARRLAGTEPIGVIAAGERWGVNAGPVRFAMEDLLGAGAVIAALCADGVTDPSVEAELAALTFEAHRDRLPTTLAQCVSGRELIDEGFASDVELAGQLEISDAAPRLENGVLRDDPTV